MKLDIHIILEEDSSYVLVTFHIHNHFPITTVSQALTVPISPVNWVNYVKKKWQPRDHGCLNEPKRPGESIKVDEPHKCIVSFKFFESDRHGNNSLILSFTIFSST